MFANETELKQEVRDFTGYTTTEVLSSDGLDAAYSNAKRHIRVKKSLSADFNWFGSEKAAAQDALYWWTCLFSKVQTGELDSQDVQVGAVEKEGLLAKNDDEVTMWYRQANQAMKSLKATTIIRSSAPSRSDRTYSPDTFSGGDSSGSGGGTNIDGTGL
jgi:hypothetical protein